MSIATFRFNHQSFSSKRDIKRQKLQNYIGKNLFWSLRDIFMEKFFIMSQAFKTLCENRLQGQKITKNIEKYGRQNSIYNTYINFFYMFQLNK